MGAGLTTTSLIEGSNQKQLEPKRKLRCGCYNFLAQGSQRIDPSRLCPNNVGSFRSSYCSLWLLVSVRNLSVKQGGTLKEGPQTFLDTIKSLHRPQSPYLLRSSRTPSQPRQHHSSPHSQSQPKRLPITDHFSNEPPSDSTVQFPAP